MDLVLGLCWRKQFVHVWNRIQEFDESYELGKISFTSRYSPMIENTRFWLWMALLGNFLVWFAINQLGMQAFNEPYVQNVSYMITYVGSCVAVFKFCGLLFLLGQRFAYLNKLVGKRTKLRINNDSLDRQVDANFIEVKIIYIYFFL